VKTFLKIVGFAAVGVIALVALGALLGFIGWVLSWAIWIGAIAAIGFVAIKLLSLGGGKAPEKEPPLSEAKTEESRTLAPAEKKALSDADALKMFEAARQKTTENK
jgi:hypothetical protein